MPRLKPSTQAARRGHILDAAEVCFARAGFHRTTMQDIATEAEVSLGALYVYFASKEALIAGIVERDRLKLRGELSQLAAAEDIVAALGKLGEHYAFEEPRHKQVLCVEMGAEATRNEAVGALFRSVDNELVELLADIFERARTQGKISPALDSRTAAMACAIIGDGMFWRRAIDPTFEAKTFMPTVLTLIGSLLNPVGMMPAYTDETGKNPAPIKEEMSS